MGIQTINNVGYGLSSALPEIFNPPIASKRAPLTTDKAPIGQIWINTTTNAAYILVSVANNSATWNLLEAGGSSGSFTTLTSTGATTLATTGASVNTFGNTTGATSLALSVGTGGFTLDGVASSAYTIGASTTTGTISIGGTAQTGNFDLAPGTGAQTVTFGNGGTGAKTINVGAGAAANVITVGTTNTTASLNLKAGSGGIGLTGAVTSANAITVTAGNITATNGNVVISTAATKLILPGPVNIMTGAGAPAGGLAVNVGDMYINTTAASAVTRLYIATAASTWTNVTCAA